MEVVMPRKKSGRAELDDRGNGSEVIGHPHMAEPLPPEGRPASPDPGAADSEGAGKPRTPAAPASEHYAAHLRDTSASLFMYASMGGVLRKVDTSAFRLFRDNLLIAAGNPSDPIVVMLIEQIALAHLNIGRLHLLSATAEGIEATRAYGSMAIALTGEFRRTALALQAYRIAGSRLAITAGDPAGPAVADVIAGAGPDGKGLDAELASTEAADDGTVPFEESAAGGRREAECPAA
jgi:hypothetical protein